MYDNGRFKKENSLEHIKLMFPKFNIITTRYTGVVVRYLYDVKPVNCHYDQI